MGNLGKYTVINLNDLKKKNTSRFDRVSSSSVKICFDTRDNFCTRM